MSWQVIMVTRHWLERNLIDRQLSEKIWSNLTIHRKKFDQNEQLIEKYLIDKEICSNHLIKMDNIAKSQFIYWVIGFGEGGGRSAPSPHTRLFVLNYLCFYLFCSFFLIINKFCIMLHTNYSISLRFHLYFGLLGYWLL